MDTLRDMEQLNKEWDAGDAAWKVWCDTAEHEQPRLLKAA